MWQLQLRFRALSCGSSAGTCATLVHFLYTQLDTSCWRVGACWVSAFCQRKVVLAATCFDSCGMPTGSKSCVVCIQCCSYGTRRSAGPVDWLRVLVTREQTCESMVGLRQQLAAGSGVWLACGVVADILAPDSLAMACQYTARMARFQSLLKGPLVSVSVSPDRAAPHSKSLVSDQVAASIPAHSTYHRKLHPITYRGKFLLVHSCYTCELQAGEAVAQKVKASQPSTTERDLQCTSTWYISNHEYACMHLPARLTQVKRST